MMTAYIWSRLPGFLIGQQGSIDFVSRMGLVDINQLKACFKIPDKNLKIYDNIKEGNAITNSEHDLIMLDGPLKQAREIEHKIE
jgi:hypothetical protein